MNERQSYTQSVQNAPVDPDREFTRQMKDGGYEAGIAGSQGRQFSRPTYESGGAYDNVLRRREMAEDPFGLRNLRPASRATTRTAYASMDISPPPDVLKAGGM